MLLSLNRPVFILLALLTPVAWILMNRSFLKDGSRKHRRINGGLRALLILIVALALSDPQIMTPSDRVNLFFCLDASRSIRSDPHTGAQRFIQKAITGMQKDDQAGLIVFGKSPSLEISLRKNFEALSMRSEISANYTNIYAALQLAIGKLPSQGKNKIVLFSDGNENLHSAAEMAYLARSLGIEIYPVPLASWFGKSEVFVKELYTPEETHLETPFEIRLVVMSSQKVHAELILLRNERLLANRSIDLQAGKNVFTFADILSAPGLSRYKAVVNCLEDSYFQNNEGLSFTRGTRKSPILYLTGKDRRSRHLAQTLEKQGLNLVHQNINALPGSLQDFIEYNAIILDNVSGTSLSMLSMENLERYVKDLGGGLIMIGGDNSFGAGYYQKTPVEKALPVFMDAPAELKFSELCLIYVIDKSSSMAGSSSGQSKLEMAKVATFSSIEMLNPTDRIGIVTFDTNVEWIVPIIKADQRQSIAHNLSQVKEGGGTDLYPALKEVLRVLKQVQSNRKHVIILSDGETEAADFKPLIQSMQQSDISVSAVSIGKGAHVGLMESIARWGQGRNYYTDDPQNIPKIFTGETQMITSHHITEKTLQPSVSMSGEMMQGIDTENLPPIYGQILTYPKPGARVLIRTTPGPLLAAWQYGLGRSVAFTSDLSSRWSKDWVSWDHYGRFAAQMVKWTQKKATRHKYITLLERAGENGILAVDVINDQNRFVNNLDLNIKILFPSGRLQNSTLEQIAPGRYQVVFATTEIGEYYFSLFGAQNGESIPPLAFGYGIPYTDEFNRIAIDRPLLEKLASITNGRVLALDTVPPNLFTAKPKLKTGGTALWPFLVLAFCLLLILDVALRKLTSR